MDSKLYRTMEWIMNAFLLNLLWLLLCLPVLTIFPATTAMFGVVREWQNRKDIHVIPSFFRHLKENFKQSLGLGVLWFIFTLILFVDLVITNGMSSGFKYVLFSFFFLLSIIYLFVTITIFPVIVHYRTTWKGGLKIALLVSVGNLPFTLLALLLFAVTAIAIYYFPAATMLCFSSMAFLIYSFVSKGFHKEDQAQSEESSMVV